MAMIVHEAPRHGFGGFVPQYEPANLEVGGHTMMLKREKGKPDRPVPMFENYIG